MIQRVRDALKQIQKIYLKYPAIGNIEKYGERVFAYEFYHQLRINFNDLQLDITGEPIKGTELIPHEGNKIIPDFVIHNYATDDHNEIAIEVKITPQLSAYKILKDLQKLELLINGPRHYNHGIFYAANCDLKRIINGSYFYKRRIKTLIQNNTQIIIWNTLGINLNENIRETLRDNEILSITLDDIN